MTDTGGGRAIVALAAIGATLSAYLTWVHYSGSLALCVGAAGCETVQASRYATVGLVPVALIGLIGLGTIGGLASWRLRADAPPAAFTALFGLSVGAGVFVAYLTFIELFVIGAICPWCVSVAVTTVAILVLAARAALETGS